MSLILNVFLIAKRSGGLSPVKYMSRSVPQRGSPVAAHVIDANDEDIAI